MQVNQINGREEEIYEIDEEIQAVPNQEARVIDLANEAPEAALAAPEAELAAPEIVLEVAAVAAIVANEPQPGPSNETDENKTKTAKKRSGMIKWC